MKLADEAGLLLLAPESRGRTWDIVLLEGGYGPDMPFIDRALAHVFERYAPLLKDAGHTVRYREFEGAHVVPPVIAREAQAWFTAP